MYNLELFIFLGMGALIMYANRKSYKKLKELGKAQFFPNGLLVFSAIFFVAFGILWAVSSLMEHETQAAMMGILIFSGFGILLAIVAYRVISSQK